MSEERLKDVTELACERLADSYELGGDPPVDLGLLVAAAETAADAPASDRAEREAVVLYISRLTEPNRTIFLKRRAGWRVHDIAKAVGLEVKPVCQCLSQMYADLRAFVKL
jgi:DNA-directed RNA polymerase specialized sigma24 family protein